MFTELLDNEASLVVDKTDGLQVKPNDLSTQDCLVNSIPDEESVSLFSVIPITWVRKVDGVCTVYTG